MQAQFNSERLQLEELNKKELLLANSQHQQLADAQIAKLRSDHAMEKLANEDKEKKAQEAKHLSEMDMAMKLVGVNAAASDVARLHAEASLKSAEIANAASIATMKLEFQVMADRKAEEVIKQQALLDAKRVETEQIMLDRQEKKDAARDALDLKNEQNRALERTAELVRREKSEKQHREDRLDERQETTHQSNKLMTKLLNGTDKALNVVSKAMTGLSPDKNKKRRRHDDSRRQRRRRDDSESVDSDDSDSEDDEHPGKRYTQLHMIQLVGVW